VLCVRLTLTLINHKGSQEIQVIQVQKARDYENNE
jgi:hypothetical protein